MNITKLALLDSGTYDAMYLRPYEINDSHRGLLRIQEATRYGQNITSSALSGVAGTVLRPTADHRGLIQISNGWGQRRYRFLMEVQDVDLLGNESMQYLTGYTDHAGVSAGGHVDPNMRFYVATTIRMKTLAYATDYGQVKQMSISDTSHVFNYNHTPSLSQDLSVTGVNLQRPQDVCTSIQASQYRRVSDQFFDPRTTFAQENVRLSRRSNAMAPKYMADVLKAGAMSLASSDNDSTEVEIWSNAEGLVKENAFSQDQVLLDLHRKTSFNEGDSFTYSELRNLCPHLDNVTKYAPNLPLQRQQAAMGTDSALPILESYDAGRYQGWGGSDVHTVWATILSNAIPALLLETMIKEIGFTIHNHKINGEIDLSFGYALPFGRHLNGPQLADQFGYRLVGEVIRDLLGGNPTAFSIRAHFDVMGESQIWIQIGTGPEVPFASPVFADHLYAPVLTVGQQSVHDLARNVEFFTSNLQTDGGMPNKSFSSNTPNQGTSNASSFSL